MTKKLGEKLKLRREELGISLGKLAIASKTSKSYLWELENVETSKPSAVKLNVIATALGLTVGYLVDDNAQMDEERYKEAFFRSFNRLAKGDQRRIKQIMNLWEPKMRGGD